MAQTLSEPRQPQPWTQRLFGAVALSPIWIGLALAAAYLVAWVAYFTLFATEAWPTVFDRPLWRPGGWWEVGVRALLVGYTPALSAFGRRGATLALDDLRPALDASDAQFAELRERVTAMDARRLRLAGAVGAAWMLAFFVLRPAPWGHSEELSDRPWFIWDGAWLALIGWLVCRALVNALRVARAFSRLGSRSIRLDLLDLRSLAPLTRFGLRTVLLWVVWFSLMALFWVGPGPGNPSNAAGLVPLFAVAVAALVIPVHGVHRRIRDAKRAELERVRAELLRERDRLLEPPGAQADARLANLVAYQALIERVREWPFDPSALLRFGLYLMIGIGSWLGAALVERGVDAWLR